MFVQGMWSETIKSSSYLLPLFDKHGKSHTITVHEIESIANNSENDISGVKHLFSSNIQNVWDRINERPVGEMDVLVGSSVLWFG